MGLLVNQCIRNLDSRRFPLTLERARGFRLESPILVGTPQLSTESFAS